MLVLNLHFNLLYKFKINVQIEIINVHIAMFNLKLNVKFEMFKLKSSNKINIFSNIVSNIIKCSNLNA